MKKTIFSILALAISCSFSLLAQTPQEQALTLKRPADCGVTDYDALKTPLSH